MTTYSPHLQSHLTGRRNPVVTLAIALVAGSAVLGLLVSGVTFLAVPIAQHYTVSISAADIALAGRIAEFWWVFATISVASFIGALVVAVKTVRHLGSPPR